MNKPLLIALTSLIIGAITLGVGLYVLSTTPAEPAQSPVEATLVFPQVADQATDVPDVPAEPGSETWCDQQMLIADADWSDNDARIFADHCLY
ncbi:MAG TPA: DUF3012 domain-containing protein [Cellvibrionaceae bacterium]